MTRLGAGQVDRVCSTAALLLPGAPDCPGPGDLTDYPDLVQQAARALSAVSTALDEAIAGLPVELTWRALASYAEEQPDRFELLSNLVLGAYFMSPAVRAALGLPAGPRKPPPRDQAVDELGTGLLDAVLERGSPARTLAEVEQAEVGRAELEAAT